MFGEGFAFVIAKRKALLSTFIELFALRVSFLSAHTRAQYPINTVFLQNHALMNTNNLQDFQLFPRVPDYHVYSLSFEK